MMRRMFGKLMDLLTKRERREFYVVMALMLVVSFFEMIGVASVLPFMAVIADPEIIGENRFLATLYDTLGFENDRSFLVFLGAGTFTIIFSGMIAHIFSHYAMVRFANMRGYDLSSRLLRGYLRQPYAWFLNRHSADLGKTILAEVDAVVNQAFMPAMKIMAMSFLAVFIAVLLIVVQPVVSLGSAAALLLCYTAIFVTARRFLTRYGKIRFAANGQRYQIAQEAMGGIKDVKLLGLEEPYIRRFQKPARRLARANTIREVLAEAPRYLLQGIAFGGMLILILLLLVSGSGTLQDILPLLAVYAFAGLRLLPALQQVYNQMARLRFSQPAVDALHRDIMEIRANQGDEDRVAPVAPLHLSERLELVDLRYSYPLSERRALDGLSLTIPARTTTGIVGGTGAGKTTAVDVILGLLEPQSGVLQVDGKTITRSNLRAWQNTVGYVPQQIFLTDDTVAANIAFGIPPDRIDHAAVERAARIAELHTFVCQELPKGYDTFVGERGVRLSGGQRQRIGIARALYHDPDVLIMDEATSALDNLTERAVMDAVHNLGRAKTIVLIAHRLSTVEGCDKIFMLEQGRVVAEGSYGELMQTSGKFRALAVGKPAA
jgi:ATP-binding cassette, subfamily B, bacterial PglK